MVTVTCTGRRVTVLPTSRLPQAPRLIHKLKLSESTFSSYGRFECLVVREVILHACVRRCGRQFRKFQWLCKICLRLTLT
jgi:hypothetical protein